MEKVTAARREGRDVAVENAKARVEYAGKLFELAAESDKPVALAELHQAQADLEEITRAEQVRQIEETARREQQALEIKVANMLAPPDDKRDAQLAGEQAILIKKLGSLEKLLREAEKPEDQAARK